MDINMTKQVSSGEIPPQHFYSFDRLSWSTVFTFVLRYSGSQPLCGTGLKTFWISKFLNVGAIRSFRNRLNQVWSGFLYPSFLKSGFRSERIPPFTQAKSNYLAPKASKDLWRAWRFLFLLPNKQVALFIMVTGPFFFELCDAKESRGTIKTCELFWWVVYAFGLTIRAFKRDASLIWFGSSKENPSHDHCPRHPVPPTELQKTPKQNHPVDVPPQLLLDRWLGRFVSCLAGFLGVFFVPHGFFHILVELPDPTEKALKK